MSLVEEKWDEILISLKEEYSVSDIAFETWLKPLKISLVTDTDLYLSGPDEQMGLSYIERKFIKPLTVVVAEVTGSTYEIKLVLPEEMKQLKQKFKKSTPVSKNTRDETYNLNPSYTFDTFVVGKNNKFAHTVSLVVAEEAASPDKQYNPLFLWGGVGLGKTHLMHSIAHHILTNSPQLKIQYVTSEVFTNEVIEAIRNGSNSQLKTMREKYRNVDVLLIDDIQFIIGKESTQEEFFNTFNALYNAGKQIVISSDKPPKEMTTLDERFRSRFQWGVMADISLPDYETRKAILLRKEETDDLNFDDTIIEYIATNIKSNIRELEGALNRLMAYSNLTKEEITLDVAKEQLESMINPNLHREVTPSLIVEIVAEHFQKTPVQLQSKSRSTDIVRPRQIAMYLIKDMTNVSLNTIGDALGGRDHSTVKHSIAKVEAELENDESAKKMIETIQKKINPN